MVKQKVAIVIDAGLQALDVAGPLDVFAESNMFVAPGEGYEAVLIAATRKPLRASNGMQIVADLTLDEATGGFDILLVAGAPEPPEADHDPAFVEWLRHVPWRSSIYGSVCTGVFALGDAGLLDGRRVTTHWQNAQELAERFPAALVERDRIYIRDGRLVTSAGVTAGIDLALALVGERHGHLVAVAVAKRLVVAMQRQGGQSQFSPFLSAPADPKSLTAKIQHYIMANLAMRHTLDSLAGETGISARTLARHFVEEAGVTPREFVERARIDAARALLEATELPFKTIAFDCGFVSADRMRQVFSDQLGITPNQYRASFWRNKPDGS